MLDPPITPAGIPNCVDITDALGPSGSDPIACTALCPAGSTFTTQCQESAPAACLTCNGGNKVCCNLGFDPANPTSHLGFQCEAKKDCEAMLPDFSTASAAPSTTP
jgi:hypothetical protein